MTAPSCSRSEALIRNSGLSSASKTATVPFAVPAASHRPVGSAARHVPGSGRSSVWRAVPSFRDRTTTCDPTRTASRSSASTASAVGVAASFAPCGFGCLSGRGRLDRSGRRCPRSRASRRRRPGPPRPAAAGRARGSACRRRAGRGRWPGPRGGRSTNATAPPTPTTAFDVAAVGQVLVDDHGATPCAVEAQARDGCGGSASRPPGRRPARSGRARS